LDLAEIERLIPGRPVERRSAAPGPRQPRRAPALESKLLARILLQPGLADMAPAAAASAPGGDPAALRAILHYFAPDHSRTLGQASAYFEGSEHQATLEEALQEPLLHQAEGSELDLEAEVRDIVARLVADQQARRQSELLRLIVAGTATPEERAEYSELLGRL